MCALVHYKVVMEWCKKDVDRQPLNGAKKPAKDEPRAIGYLE
jgi:hypothetical protein